MKRKDFRKLIIKEIYKTSLKVLYEADDPAAAPPADPAAAPPPDPAAAPPAPDPTVLPDPGAAPQDPMTMPPAAPLAGLGAPPADPMAGLGAPAVPPTTTATSAPPKKTVKAKPPNPNEDPANFQIYSALHKAISSAKNAANESLRKRNLKFLYEAEEKEEEKDDGSSGSSPDIDIDNFAGSIANLIKNYTSLVDVKKAVIDQANFYLGQEFPDQAEALRRQLKDSLRKNYHISLERSEEPRDSYAVGAGTSGGGAA